MWVATRISAFRARRRDAAVRAHELEAFTAGVAHQRAARWSYHCSTTPTAVDALHAATRLGADVWCRRVDHADAYRVALGWGPVSWDVAVASPPHEAIAPEVLAVVTSAGRFADATIPLTLAPGSSLAVTGLGADGVVRSLVVQLATWLGPADWRLLVVAEDPAAWDWARWLPHGPGRAAAVVGADDADAQTAVFTAFDDGDHRHVVVVTDRPELLAQRTGALRRFLAACTSAAVVVRVPGDDAVPALCRSVVEIGSVGLARWWPDVADASPESRSMPALHVAGITVADAHRAARSLAGLRDPEDPALAIDALATSITLGALFDERGTGAIDDAIGIAAGWRARGTEPMPTVALGAAADGIVEVDLVRDGPHVLVAGTTGSGKSELLRTLVVSLAARASPDHVTFVLIDYKGGATFDACADLPHTVGVVTDLDDRLAERALCSLDAEVRRRERLLRAVGATDLAAYRSDPARPKLPRLVVVVDEFAALAAELPTFLSSLVGVAQRGRSLGVHLVLATQRPAGVVDDEIRANTNLRLALRLHDVADARDVVGDDAPARFSRGTPGRAMLRLGPAETVVFQSARCTGPARLGGGHEEHLRVLTAPSGDTTAATTELAVLVRSIRNAAVLSDVAAPHRPWLPPLPELLDGGVPLGAVGLIDVPAEQRRVDLRWTPAAGNLALIGALGAGTTTALLSIVGAVLEHGREHVYVIDARGDDRLDALVVAPRCGGVIRPHEGERLGRLLDRLVGELDERRSAGQRDERPGVMLAVDGVAALRAVLDAPLDSSRWEQLVRIISEGAAVGVTCVLTGERPTAMPGALLAACSDRWVFHLDDPTEATGCGVRAAIVPPPIPGRLIVASTGGEAQLAMPSMNAAPRDDDDTVRPPAIGVLARSVDAATMPVGATTAAGEIELVMGIDHATLDVARLAVPPGEHLLVVGPARSGRTTALRRLAESWSTACPEGVVLVVGQRPGHPLVSGAAEVAAAELPMRVDGAPGPVLVVIDDAEHVDDPAIAAILGRRRPGLLVMATGRPVSLRAMYGHWTSIVRRSRLGLAMSACTDTDGDVLGELLPRHRPLPARPGLAYVIDGGGRRLVQLAWRPPVDLR
ncbi:MAG: FtsK/SpoIIIE domain-containing protein [Ilumatobacteraceae bacterium]